MYTQTGAMSAPSPILPYNREAYRLFYDTEFCQDFQHKPFVEGVTDKEEARSVVARLNACKVVGTISFNPDMITGDQLSGGACTVVALRVAEIAMQTQAMLQTCQDLTEHEKQIILLNKVSQQVLQMHAEGPEERKKVRTLQQAFNTITVDRDMKTVDVCQDKIKAMVALYGMTVSHSTAEVPVVGNPHLGCEFQREFQALQPGVYLLRIIDFKNNHKLEEQGHSATYIKTAEMELYFDPALGLFNLFKGAKKTNLILHALYSAHLRFNVSLF